MIFRFDEKARKDSHFVIENYFAAIIEFSKEQTNNFFIKYQHEDSDLFEIQINKCDMSINRFVLTLCNDFDIKTENIIVPEFLNGSLIITDFKDTYTDIFKTTIYNDGIKIVISKENPKVHLRCGQLVFGFNENDKLCCVYITDLSKSEIEHVKEEIAS